MAGKLSQEQLARKVGVSQGLIAQIEKGTNQGSKHIASIARALNVSADWLETGLGQRDRAPANAPAQAGQDERQPPPVWPFSHMTAEFWFSAPAEVRLRAEALAEGTIIEWKQAQPKKAKKPAGKSDRAA